jgi:hypothetical protein
VQAGRASYSLDPRGLCSPLWVCGGGLGRGLGWGERFGLLRSLMGRRKDDAFSSTIKGE